jgi:hypothetical protein
MQHHSWPGWFETSDGLGELQEFPLKLFVGLSLTIEVTHR